MRYCGRRHRSDKINIHTHGNQAAGQSRFNHVTGKAGVLADNDTRSALPLSPGPPCLLRNLELRYAGIGNWPAVQCESAGVTLVKGDLRGIVRARRLSRAAMANIRQNLFFAFAYNALGVPVAAGVLYPFFGLLLSPMLAAVAMSFSSVSVISNSLRLRRKEI